MTRTRPLSADQRDILRAMQDGAPLCHDESAWWLVSSRGMRYAANGNSCRGLETRALIREDEPIGRGIYVLTEAGRAALCGVSE